MNWFSRFALTSAVLLLLAAGVTFASAGSEDDSSAPSPATPDVSVTDTEIARLQSWLQLDRNDSGALVQLGFAYLQKSRENSDSSLYRKAQDAFRESLAVNPGDPEALIGLSSASLFMHDFAAALLCAEQAINSGQPTPAAYGAQGDALMELGRYEEAVDAFQKMVDLRPDLDSYVRVSYARELRGDVAGAIDAMEFAVEAAGFKGESAAWTHTQLGNLYFNRGDVSSADGHYLHALESFPGYAPALAGRGRVAAANRDYATAEKLYLDATTRAPVLQNIAALGDVYLLDGKPAEAQRQFDLVGAIAKLYQANGVRTDLELALFYADHDLNRDEAVEQALAAYSAAPSVPAADAVAWALFKAGRATEALPYAEKALAQGTQDAALLYHLGLIQTELGSAEAARDSLSRALEINPHFSTLQAPVAKQALQELGT
jgi:tetratricopeptide (TPR) repeat protein